MGERKGTNKYYPPDFDPSIHSSLDAYHGTHALRERAKKIKQGIIVIRFEMPYNIWCGGCGRHVAMGVRYNAEKSKVGMYYSTPVYQFKMKCHLCDNYYVIRTDPGNYDYEIVSGAKRKEQRWDPAENGQIVPDDSDTKQKLAADAMFQLERGADDAGKLKEAAPALRRLRTDADSRHSQDVLLNRLVRERLRARRRLADGERRATAEFLGRHSLAGGGLKLLPEADADARRARLLRLSGTAVAAASSSSSSSSTGGQQRPVLPATADAKKRRRSAPTFGQPSPPAKLPCELHRRSLGVQLRAEAGQLVQYSDDSGDGDGDAAA